MTVEGAVVDSATGKVAQWISRRFSPKELCWACIGITLASFWFFTNNYARARDLDAVRTDVTSIQIQSLQSELIDLRIRQCKSATGDKQWYATRIGELQRRYAQLDDRRQEFSLPRCEDL